jgi:metal-sulfur cluster biosynthetic enzyme
VLELVSHHDTARQPEAVFHAFCLGLLSNLRMIYDIRSNHEVGYGRADVTMKPKTDRFPSGFVIEFKSIKSDDDMEQALEDALVQIKTKAYDTELERDGVAPIYRVAIVLKGKHVKVAF